MLIMLNLWKYSKWINLYNNQYTYVFWNNLVATAVTAHKPTLLVFTVRSHLLPAGFNPASTTPSVRMKMGTTPAFAGQVTKIKLIFVNWNNVINRPNFEFNIVVLNLYLLKGSCMWLLDVFILVMFIHVK